MSNSILNDFPSPLIHKQVLIDLLTRWDKYMQDRERNNAAIREQASIKTWLVIAAIAGILIVVNGYVFLNADSNLIYSVFWYSTVPSVLIMFLSMLGVHTGIKNAKKKSPETNEQKVVKTILASIEIHANELSLLENLWSRLPQEERKYRAERLIILKYSIYTVSNRFLETFDHNDPDALQNVKSEIIVLQHFSSSYTCHSTETIGVAGNQVIETAGLH